MGRGERAGVGGSPSCTNAPPVPDSVVVIGYTDKQLSHFYLPLFSVGVQFASSGAGLHCPGKQIGSYKNCFPL